MKTRYRYIFKKGSEGMGLFRRRKSKKDNSLLKEIADAQRALETAYSNFENVIDPDLIDCYIYQVNAIQHRYKYLLKQAKLAEQTYSV